MEQECSTLQCFIYISDTLLHIGTRTRGETGEKHWGNGVDVCVYVLPVMRK